MEENYNNQTFLSMKQITSTKEFPTNSHFAILIFKTSEIHHEGDERSKNNPGHGYPAYTETINNIEYLFFDNQNEWENKLKELYEEDSKRTDIVGIPVGAKAKITSEILINA